MTIILLAVMTIAVVAVAYDNYRLRKCCKDDVGTREAICKAAGVDDIGEVSDGFHTFNALYRQRMVLFAALVKTFRDKSWKSWKHEDGELCFGGGWFIVGIDTPAGQYTYHYEAKDWDRFDCEALETGKHWDGHTDADVERLMSLEVPTKEVKTKKAKKNGNR